MIRPPAPGTKNAKTQDRDEAPLVKVLVKVGNVSISRAIDRNEVEILGLPALVNRLKFGELAEWGVAAANRKASGKDL